MTKKILSAIFFLCSLVLPAQENVPGPQMANQFRADGKIYVVITVISLVFAAIVVFLIILEKQIKTLETQLKLNEGSTSGL